MGWMKNKAVAIVLLVVAIAVIGFMVKKQATPLQTKLTLKCAEKACGAVSHDVLLSVDAQFPVQCPKCKKISAKKAEQYFNTKTKKVVYICEGDTPSPDMIPGGDPSAAAKPAEKKP
jgi:phage FluMu protein Com